MESKDNLKEIDIKNRTCYLKILIGANSLIGNNNIRSAMLDIKNDRSKFVKILIFCSLSRQHFQSK